MHAKKGLRARFFKLNLLFALAVMPSTLSRPARHSVAKARASVQASTVRNICTTSLRKRERDDRLISRGRSSK